MPLACCHAPSELNFSRGWGVPFVNCFGGHCTGSHFHFVADQQEIRLSCRTKVRKATKHIIPPWGLCFFQDSLASPKTVEVIRSGAHTEELFTGGGHAVFCSRITLCYLLYRLWIYYSSNILGYLLLPLINRSGFLDQRLPLTQVHLLWPYLWFIILFIGINDDGNIGWVTLKSGPLSAGSSSAGLSIFYNCSALAFAPRWTTHPEGQRAGDAEWKVYSDLWHVLILILHWFVLLIAFPSRMRVGKHLEKW